MLHTAVLFAFLAGILGMMLGLLSARPILMAIKTPALVLEQALPLPLIFQLLFPMLKTGIPAAVQGAVFCFANIFVQTATTFSSQNFSSGNKKRCKKILHLCLIFSIFFCVVLTLPLTFWRAKACSLFSSDEAVIRLACIRIMCILLFLYGERFIKRLLFNPLYFSQPAHSWLQNFHRATITEIAIFILLCLSFLFRFFAVFNQITGSHIHRFY